MISTLTKSIIWEVLKFHNNTSETSHQGWGICVWRGMRRMDRNIEEDKFVLNKVNGHGNIHHFSMISSYKRNYEWETTLQEAKYCLKIPGYNNGRSINQ